MRKLILYAEDDDNDVFLMQRAFKRIDLEHRLLALPDGSQAIDYLSASGAFQDREKNPLPSLALLDLSMPGKTGFEVLQWLRSNPPTEALPVLILTSSSQEADILRAYRLGANGYLVKPSGAEELLAIVKSIKDFWLTQNRLPASFKDFTL
jgi:CheY-like chemotaxis protein